MTFVWPFIMSPSFYNKGGFFYELEYSIKSVKKYFQGEADCWVVGDDPHLDVNYIPVERKRHGVIGWERHIDQLAKLRATIESNIPDDFVWMYDDTFFLNPITEEDLTQTYAYNRVEDVDKYIRKWSRTYAMLWKDTYRTIREFREDLWDWETHLPRYLNKGKVLDTIERFRLDENNKILTSLYHATHEQGTVLMGDIQYDLISWPPRTPLEEGFKRKFLNLMDSAITFEFVDKLKSIL